MPFASSSQKRSALFKALAAQRACLAEQDQKALATSNTFVFANCNWVSLWFDPGHAVASDFGTMTAYRAITTAGELIWYVVPEAGAPVYHAQCADPVQAMDHAAEVHRGQHALRDEWHLVETIAQDLRSGTQQFDVTLDDARDAPMCPLGFKAVMASVGLFGFKRISGKTAAKLMAVEPQMGFVIHAAWKRANTSRIKGMITIPTPVGYEAIC